MWGGGFKEISVSELAVSGVSEASTANAFGSWLPDCRIQVKPGHTACKMEIEQSCKAPRGFEPQHSLVIFSPRVDKCDTVSPPVRSTISPCDIHHTSEVSGPARYSSPLKQTGRTCILIVPKSTMGKRNIRFTTSAPKKLPHLHKRKPTI